MNATATLTADCTLYAQPYNIDAVGFYFTSAEEYEQKAEGLTDRYGCPVEEFEIQYIDGDDGALFSAVGVDQSNLEAWFELLDLEDYDRFARDCDLGGDMSEFEFNGTTYTCTNAACL